MNEKEKRRYHLRCLQLESEIRKTKEKVNDLIKKCEKLQLEHGKIKYLLKKEKEQEGKGLK